MPVTVHVEFYGIARQRAGTAGATIEAESAVAGEVLLGDVLRQLVDKFPGLAGECIRNDRLQRGFIANVAGGRFVSEPATAIRSGQSLMIMSADAGG